MVGLSQSHISNLELEIEDPSFKVFTNICNALKTHPLEMLDIEEVS